METPETNKIPEVLEVNRPSKYISWIINSILFIIIFVFMLIYINSKLKKYEYIIFESIILPNANLDFQNKSGVARIKSSFTDILIASDGSIKKGDGYELILRIINPSSITLQNVKCEFRYSGSSMPVNCEEINMYIAPGHSKQMKCFVSDLSDNDLKSIDVSVHFDQMRSY